MYTYAEWPLHETRGARSRGRDGIDRRLCVRRDRARRGSASRDLQDARVDAPTHAKEERRPRGRVPSRRSGRAGAMPSRGTRGRGREAEAVPPRQGRAHPPVQKGSVDVDADAVEACRRRRQASTASPRSGSSTSTPSVSDGTSRGADGASSSGSPGGPRPSSSPPGSSRPSSSPSTASTHGPSRRRRRRSTSSPSKPRRRESHSRSCTLSYETTKTTWTPPGTGSR